MKRAMVALALAAATAAGAQDGPGQTVEGAQRFLSVLAEQRELSIIASGQAPMANYWVDRVRGSGCSTAFDVSPRAYMRIGQPRREVGQPGFTVAEFASVIEKHGYPTPPFAVDWSRAGAIGLQPLTETGQNQILSVAQGDRTIVVYVLDAALADRVLKAAQFLKTACDPTAETGF